MGGRRVKGSRYGRMGGFCRVARLSLQAQAVKDSIEPEALRAEGEGFDRVFDSIEPEAQRAPRGGSMWLALL